ncbi:MAG: ion channel, partial [Candidatus Nanoarchaeia archaeon]
KKLLTVLLIILSYLLIVSHLIWFIERGHDNFSKEYAKGIVQGVWWAVVTMSTVGYGDFAPKRFWGRALGILIIFSGIILFGFAIAVLSSVFTVSQLQTSISGVDDLAGHSVAVIDGSVAQKAMSRYGVQQVSVATFKEGIAKIENKEADAFVHDTPMLQYYIKNNPGFILAERAFEPSDYGMTFPEGSRYREEFNRALLKSMEGDGSEYDKLRQKWFG